MLRKQGMATYLSSRQPETGRKHIRNKKGSYDEMQSQPAWETQHFQGSYQELALAREEEIASALGKTGSYKYKKNLH